MLEVGFLFSGPNASAFCGLIFFLRTLPCFFRQPSPALLLAMLFYSLGFGFLVGSGYCVGFGFGLSGLFCIFALYL